MSDANELSILNLRESFFHEDLNSVDEFFNNVDDRVNHKIAQGMKKAIRLIVGQFDKHMLNKMKLMVKDEVDDRLKEIRDAKRQKSTSTNRSKESYTRFNGVRPPSNHINLKQNNESVERVDASLSTNSYGSVTKELEGTQKQFTEEDSSAEKDKEIDKRKPKQQIQSADAAPEPQQQPDIMNIKMKQTKANQSQQNEQDEKNMDVSTVDLDENAMHMKTPKFHRNSVEENESAKGLVYQQNASEELAAPASIREEIHNESEKSSEKKIKNKELRVAGFTANSSLMTSQEQNINNTVVIKPSAKLSPKKQNKKSSNDNKTVTLNNQKKTTKRDTKPQAQKITPSNFAPVLKNKQKQLNKTKSSLKMNQTQQNIQLPRVNKNALIKETPDLTQQNTVRNNSLGSRNKSQVSRNPIVDLRQEAKKISVTREKRFRSKSNNTVRKRSKSQKQQEEGDQTPTSYDLQIKQDILNIQNKRFRKNLPDYMLKNIVSSLKKKQDKYIKEVPIGQSLGITLNETVNVDQQKKYQAKFSIPKDAMADIYKNKDPIDASLKMRYRLSGGYISDVVRLRHHVDKQDKFFFQLRIKGDPEFENKKKKKLRLKQWREKMIEEENKERAKHGLSPISLSRLNPKKNSKKNRKHKSQQKPGDRENNNIKDEQEDPEMSRSEHARSMRQLRDEVSSLQNSLQIRKSSLENLKKRINSAEKVEGHNNIFKEGGSSDRSQLQLIKTRSLSHINQVNMGNINLYNMARSHSLSRSPSSPHKSRNMGLQSTQIEQNQMMDFQIHNYRSYQAMYMNHSMDFSNLAIPETSNPRQEEDPLSTEKPSLRNEKIEEAHINKERIFLQEIPELILEDSAVDQLMEGENIPKINIEESKIKADLEKKLVEKYKCTICNQFPYLPQECKKCMKIYCKSCQVDIIKQEKKRAAEDLNPVEEPAAEGAEQLELQDIEKDESISNEVACCPKCTDENGENTYDLGDVNTNMHDFIEQCKFPHKCTKDVGPIMWSSVNQLYDHLQKDQCFRYECKHCDVKENKCLTRDQLRQHLKNECTEVLIACKLCSQEFKRCDFNTHKCPAKEKGKDGKGKKSGKDASKKMQSLCKKKTCLKKFKLLDKMQQEINFTARQFTRETECANCSTKIEGQNLVHTCRFCNDDFCKKCVQQAKKGIETGDRQNIIPGGQEKGKKTVRNSNLSSRKSQIS